MGVDCPVMNFSARSGDLSAHELVVEEEHTILEYFGVRERSIKVVVPASVESAFQSDSIVLRPTKEEHKDQPTSAIHTPVIHKVCASKKKQNAAFLHFLINHCTKFVRLKLEMKIVFFVVPKNHSVEIAESDGVNGHYAPPTPSSKESCDEDDYGDDEYVEEDHKTCPMSMTMSGTN